MSDQYNKFNALLDRGSLNQDTPAKTGMAIKLSILLRDLEHVTYEAKHGGVHMSGADHNDPIRSLRMEFGYDDRGDMAALQLTNARIANFRGGAEPVIQLEVAAKLKSLYANVVEEEIPARFLSLLKQMPRQSLLLKSAVHQI